MRSLIQMQLKEDDFFEGQPSQVLDIPAGAQYEGPEVGDERVADEAPLNLANHRGGILTTWRCRSCALY